MMFEIYYVVPKKGDRSSKDDLLEYSLREVVDKHTLIHEYFGDIKDVVSCIVGNCIGYYTKTCYISSKTFVKCPFVLRYNGIVFFDSSKDANICEVYSYMASQREMELDVSMKFENWIEIHGYEREEET